MNLLKIRNATAWRGKTKVFNGFDLDVPWGESTAILGPNGAGKSTLLKIVTRQIYPNPTPKCVVEILGKTRWNVWELRKKMGIVSHDQQNRYRDDVTGYDVVSSGFFCSVGVPDHLDMDDAQRARAEQLLAELSIENLRSKAYGTMSTGEQRRCLLARALVHDPASMIFDEPTAGLDIPGIFQYLLTASRLIQQGKTLVVVTHHVHEIPPEVTNVILLKKGEVFRTGTKEEILCDSVISELYETPVRIVESNGYLAAVPG